MNTIRHTGWLAAIALSIFHSTQATTHGADVPLADAASLISAAEARSRNIAFKSRMATITFDADRDPATVTVSSPESATSHIRWDFLTSRYFASIDSVQRAVTVADKASPPLFYGSRNEFAKNSQLMQFWSRGIVTESPTVPNDTVEIDQSGRQGVIAPAAEERRRIQDAGFVAIHGMQVGVNWLPQLAWSRFSPPQKLSTILTEPLGEKDQTSVDLNEDGTWQVRISRRSTATPYDWSLQYDPLRCRPLRSSWSVMTQTSPEEMTESTRVYFEYLDDAAPLPRRVVLMELLGAPRGYQWEYALVSYNDDVSDAEFQVTFPPGVEVTDYVRQCNYIVGVSAKEDEAAVERFMEREGLLQRDGAAPKARGVWPLIAVNAAVATLVAIALIWCRRCRNRRVSLLTTPWLGYIFCANAASAATQPPISDPYITQCGLTSSICVMKMLRVDYNLDAVRAALASDHNGTKMSCIVYTLRAHGLDVDARSGATVDGIDRSIRHGVVAIVAVRMKNGRWHYVVCMRHPSTGINVVVDVLIGTAQIRRGLDEAQLAGSGGVVAFVRKPRVAPSPDVVEFRASTINIGKFAAGETSPRKVKIILENRSDSPVLVVSVLGACGCIAAEWSRGLIPPKGQQPVVINVSPIGWAEKEQEKSVRAVTQRGATAELTIVGGRGKTSRTEISASTVEIDVTKELSRPGVLSAAGTQFSIVGATSVVESVRVNSSEAWLTCEIAKAQAVENGKEVLVASCTPVVTLSDSLRLHLARSRHVRGVIQIHEGTGIDVLSEVVVVASRKPLCEISPNPSVVAPGDEVILAVERCDWMEKGALRLMSFRCIPAGFECTVKGPVEGRILQFVLTPKPNIPSGARLLTFELENTDPQIIDVVSAVICIGPCQQLPPEK